MAESEAVSSGFNDQNQEDDYEDDSDEDDSREYIEREKRPSRSTKQPLPNKQQKLSRKSKEDCLMERASSTLDSTHRKKKADADETFGQNVWSKEIANVKIQEILCKAQFGLFQSPSQRDPAAHSTPYCPRSGAPDNSPIYLPINANSTSMFGSGVTYTDLF